MSLLGTIASIGSAVTGVGSALVPGLGPVSQALGGVANSQSQADANAANLQIARENNAFNEKMWNQTNAYNTPEQQRMRMQQAGYNPYLTSGQVSTGSAQATPTAAPVSAMQSIRGGDAGIQSAQNAMNMITMKANVATAQAQAEKAQAEAQKAIADANATRAGTPYIAPQAAANVESTNLRNAITREFGSAKAQADINNLVAGAVSYNSQALQSQESVNLMAAQILKTYAETANVKMSTEQMRTLLPLTAASIRAQANASNASANASNAQAGYTNTQAGYIPVKVSQDLRESDSRIRKNDFESQGMNFGVFRTPGPSQMTTWFNQAINKFNPVNLMLDAGRSLLPDNRRPMNKRASIHR